jgi:hypothetical protein
VNHSLSERDAPGFSHMALNDSRSGIQLLGQCRRTDEEKIRLFYARIPANFEVINPDNEDLPELASA